MCVLGGFNVDMLPTLAADPWRTQPNRRRVPAEQRSVLREWMGPLRVKEHLPYVVYSRPGGPYDQHCDAVPFTRLPLGA
eukprot:14714822-Alexandrium_andersonii.AAC.1